MRMWNRLDIVSNGVTINQQILILNRHNKPNMWDNHSIGYKNKSKKTKKRLYISSDGQHCNNMFNASLEIQLD